MSVWFTIPSARPPEEAEKCLREWRELGYKIALFVDWNPPGQPLETRISKGDLMLRGGGRFAPQFDPKTGLPLTEQQTYPPDWNEYPGYALAVNSLIKEVLKRDPGAQWFIAAGDDTLPDPNHTPEEIARQCSRHFGETHQQFRMEHVVSNIPLPKQPSVRMPWSTFGVMQPTGDRFAGGSIDRIAGSPWIGREFAERMYGGNGPYWHEYRHMWVDEEIMCVAQKLGVFWQRPDLIHKHNHFMRESDAINSPAVRKPIPPHLVEANSSQHWEHYGAIFRRRKAQNFPGHEPLATIGSDSHGIPATSAT